MSRDRTPSAEADLQRIADALEDLSEIQRDMLTLLERFVDALEQDDDDDPRGRARARAKNTIDTTGKAIRASVIGLLPKGRKR